MGGLQGFKCPQSLSLQTARNSDPSAVQRKQSSNLQATSIAQSSCACICDLQGRSTIQIPATRASSRPQWNFWFIKARRTCDRSGMHLQSAMQVVASALASPSAPCPELSAVLGAPCQIAKQMRVAFVGASVGDIILLGDAAVIVDACVHSGCEGGSFRLLARKLALQERPSSTTSSWTVTDERCLVCMEDGWKHASCWHASGQRTVVLGFQPGADLDRATGTPECHGRERRERCHVTAARPRQS